MNEPYMSDAEMRVGRLVSGMDARQVENARNCEVQRLRSRLSDLRSAVSVKETAIKSLKDREDLKRVCPIATRELRKEIEGLKKSMRDAVEALASWGEEE